MLSSKTPMVRPALKYQAQAMTPLKVSFRDLVPEIKETTYSTHAIYYYPAKFIPHVVRFCLKSYTAEHDWVIDPFAGSGTVGLEAFLTKRNALISDLNYLLEHIVPVKIFKGNDELSIDQLDELIVQIKNEQEQFIPQYENIGYWYPEDMFDVLSQYWAGLHKETPNIHKWIVQAALVKISKLFSFAEHRTPKLFKSKYKKQFIEDLLKTDWKKNLDEKLSSLSHSYYHAVKSLRDETQGYDTIVEYSAGLDASKFDLGCSRGYAALITSPPYLQAQEYIRTSKLDLFWIGYTEAQIKDLTKLEIPYRAPERIVATETLDDIRGQIKKPHLLRIFNSYFDHLLSSFEKNMQLLKKDGKACIFVGNPKIDGIEVETWRIITEYFLDRGFEFETVYDDEIKTRQLFGSRKNKNPDGMKSEYLLVLTKKYA